VSAGSVIWAFLAGLISIVTPCVLPLVPGYLSAVSAVEPNRLGDPGVGRRVLVSSVPFFIGFTIVFVALGAGAAALGGVLPAERRTEVAGLILIVFGLAFLGLLPIPERLLAPSLIDSARRRGSVLLGAAFAVCAAPCVGPILGSALALAGRSDTVVQGSFLLVIYSVGLSLGFLLAGIGFVRAMGAFRWLRDHYVYVQWVSGILLIALGLLLFFHRDWWLRVMVNRMLDAVGLGEL
jgi:cytochrome c-type biogenesis protein